MKADRDILISKISALKVGIQSEQLDEDAAQALVKYISELVPNTKFSDLYFYPEKERSVEEIVDELLKRQELLQSYDVNYLNEYIKGKYEKILNDPVADIRTKYNAMSVLQYM